METERVLPRARARGFRRKLAIFVVALCARAGARQVLGRQGGEGVRAAAVQDKKWIVTADTGPDSMMVVWERESGR